MINILNAYKIVKSNFNHIENRHFRHCSYVLTLFTGNASSDIYTNICITLIWITHKWACCNLLKTYFTFPISPSVTVSQHFLLYWLILSWHFKFFSLFLCITFPAFFSFWFLLHQYLKLVQHFLCISLKVSQHFINTHWILSQQFLLRCTMSLNQSVGQPPYLVWPIFCACQLCHAPCLIQPKPCNNILKIYN